MRKVHLNGKRDVGLRVDATRCMLLARLSPILMSASSWVPPPQAAILWDIDGTLVESTKLAFDATNEV